MNWLSKWLACVVIVVAASAPLRALAGSASTGDRMAEWAAAQEFSGVIAVRKAGMAPVQKAFGIADEETGRAITPETVFQAGSVSKYFAAVAAFGMAERGLVDLDAPISTYLRDYREDTGAQVTLAHLLSNSSGIPNALSPVVNGLPAELRAHPGTTLASLGYADLSLADGVARYCSGALRFAPGSAFDYSNSNWPLVHLVLERAAGLPFHEVLKRYVFDPAGMHRSGTFVMDMRNAVPSRDDFAIGYDPADPKHDGDYPLPAFAGGGAYTSALDLIALEDALHTGGLFGSELLERFRTVVHPTEGYAYGGRFAEVELGGIERKVSLLSGSNGATKVTLVYDTTTSNAVVMLSNTKGGQDSMFDFSGEVLEGMY